MDDREGLESEGLSPLDDVKFSSIDGNTFKETFKFDKNDSSISLDSVYTTERLLDKLDLSIDDELLLQRALNDNEQKRISESPNNQKPTLCVPASGFLSLRNNVGGNLIHKGKLNDDSVPKLINDLVHDKRLLSLKGSVIENHVSKLRYSYWVVEESDSENEHALSHNNTLFTHQNFNIDKYRVKNNSLQDSFYYGLNTPDIKSTPTNPPQSTFNTPTPLHTPQISMSSAKINLPTTHSSMESDQSKNTGTFSNLDSNLLQSPLSILNKSKFSGECDYPLTTTSNILLESKTDKKKGNFSFKKLFKSPKLSKRTSLSIDKTNHVKTPNDDININSKFHDLDGKHYSANYSYKILIDPRPNFLVQPGEDNSIKHERINSVDSTSDSSQNVLFSCATKTNQYGDGLCLTSDRRIRLAIELRNNGYLKESTQQLIIACKMNNKTAFLLYGLALRYGSGIQVNLSESFKWIQGATSISNVEEEIFSLNINPFLLKDIPLSPPEPLAPALYEVGLSYLKGYGVEIIDEWRGLKYLEKAASLGHVDSMCLCGTIWSRKSKVTEDDKARAAAWFRLADKNGAYLVGTDWIYKDKYMKN